MIVLSGVVILLCIVPFIFLVVTLVNDDDAFYFRFDKFYVIMKENEHYLHTRGFLGARRNRIQVYSTIFSLLQKYFERTSKYQTSGLNLGMQL